MTQEEIDRQAALFLAAGRQNMPVPISIWREWMATKSIGAVDAKALSKGKIKPSDKTPRHLKLGKAMKARRKADAWQKKGAR